jgi:hypothetical protein
VCFVTLQAVFWYIDSCIYCLYAVYMATKKAATPTCGIDDRPTVWDPEVKAWRCTRCGAYWTTTNGADYAPPKENDE